MRRANDYWADAIDGGVASGEFRDDLDPRQFHRMLRESVWSTVRFNRATLAADAERLRHDLIAVFLDGCATGARVASAPIPATSPSGSGQADESGDAVDVSEIAELRRDVRELKEAIRELRSLRVVRGG
ncbi:hypothetical protein P9209_08995 [Prescottella defluvii]|nr:hypothetical protein P9209_08995 [Prescottella defluvii]